LTKEAIKAATRGANGLEARKFIVEKDDEFFFALLATNNGKSAARLLGGFPGLFGRRVIARVGLSP
jgi:hypothetical protein